MTSESAPSAKRASGIIGVLGTVSLVLAVFAPIMGISGAISYSAGQSLTENSVAATAEVVSVERRTTGTKYRHHYYFTTVAFATPEGGTVTTELPRTSDQPDYTTGDRVAVAYDSTHPESVTLADDVRFATTDGLVKIILGVVSAIAVLIMVLIIRRLFRRNRGLLTGGAGQA